MKPGIFSVAVISILISFVAFGICFSVVSAWMVVLIFVVVIVTCLASKPDRQRNISSSKKTSPSRLTSYGFHTAAETDDRQTSCEVFFGHDVALGVGEYLDRSPSSSPSSDSRLFSFLKKLIDAHHWCLIFQFNDLKIMICELDLDEDGNTIVGVYRPVDSKDFQRYGPYFVSICSKPLSPKQVQTAVKKHPMNENTYNLNQQSCQEWIIGLAEALHFKEDLDKAIHGKRDEYYWANVFVQYAKPTKSKLVAAEKQIIHDAVRAHLQQLNGKRP